MMFTNLKSCDQEFNNILIFLHSYWTSYKLIILVENMLFFVAIERKKKFQPGKHS